MKRVLQSLVVIIFFSMITLALAKVEASDPQANIKSIENAVWYGIVTLTTVGYGDYYPVTPTGKVLGLFIILGSLGLLGYLLGQLTQRINSYMEKKKNGFFGTDFEHHYIIVGWNTFASQVADQIFASGNKIAFVTNSSDDLERIKDLYPKEKAFALFMDYHNNTTFHKVNIEKSKAIFVNFADDTQSLVFVLKLQELYSKLNIIVNCTTPELKDTLKNIGVSHVVSQSEVASKMIASYMFEPHVAEYADDLLATSTGIDEQDIMQFKVVTSNPYANKSYFDAFVELKKNHNGILIGLVINDKLEKNPKDEQVILPGHFLVIIARDQDKKMFESLFGVSEGF